MRWLFARKGYHSDAVSAQDVAVYTRAYQQPGAMTAGFAYYRAIFESARQNKESAKTKLTMPVLALAGETGVGDALRKTMEAVAINVRGEVLPGCGHYLPDEQPAEFTAKVIAFLRAEQVAPAEKPPAAAGIPGARGVDHTGLNVPDLDAAITFFTEVLGAQLLWRIGPLGGGELMPTHYGVDPSLRVRLATLRCGPNLNVELLQYVTPEGRSASLEEPSNSDLSVGHLAFLVDDMAAAADYLAACGVRLFAGPKRDADGPKAGEEHRYLLTPWGSSLELVWRPSPFTLRTDDLRPPLRAAASHFRQRTLKAFLLSALVGFAVGLFYAAVRVKSPAPPLVALVGLLGMVLGEQAWPWVRALFANLFR